MATSAEVPPEESSAYEVVQLIDDELDDSTSDAEEEAGAADIVYHGDAVEQHLLGEEPRDEDEAAEDGAELDEGPSEPPARGRGRGRGSRGRGRGRGRARARHTNLGTWLDTEQDVDIPPFIAEAGPTERCMSVATPLEALDLFMDGEMLSHIRLYTNRRAHQILARPNPPAFMSNFQTIELKDLQCYLAILIYMKLVNLPSENMYWSTDPKYALPVVRQTMSRTRFRQIKAAFCVALPWEAENKEDKLAKVRPFINMVKDRMKRNYVPHQDLGLDESQIRCSHRGARVAYRAAKVKKPMKDYINVFAVHESITGYCATFQVDERKGQKDRTKLVVDDMVGELPRNPYKIAVDRLYCTVDTVRDIRRKYSAYLYGTCRTDRGVPPELMERARVECPERGQWVWSMTTCGMLCAVWHDSIIIPFLSTCHSPEEVTVRRRVTGQAPATITAPRVAADYNKYMGACDQANSLRKSYNVQLRHKHRWYMSMVYYCIDMMIINAMIIFRAVRNLNKTNMSQLKFRELLVEGLFARALGAGAGQGVQTPVRKRKRVANRKSPLDALPDERLLGRDHFPTSEKTPGEAYTTHNCKWCYYTSGKVKRTSFRCTKCNVNLHVDRPCFALYHSATNK